MENLNKVKKAKDLVKSIVTQAKLYEVEDVQNELEELTDDEEEINKQPHQQLKDMWYIKKDIRVSFKKDGEPPLTKFVSN